MKTKEEIKFPINFVKQNKEGNKAKFFSHSRLSTFEQCKLKYRFRYIDKIIPEIEKTIESHLGKVVHSTLEWLYRKIKNDKIPSVDEMISYYSNAWKEEYEEGIPIIKKGLNSEHYFNKGIQFLINYYTEHKPFDDNTIDVEKEIEFVLDDSGEYKIRGFIDRLAHNPKTGEYEVHDYKTTGNFPSDEEIENDRQLALYAIGIKEIYGKEKDVRLIWHYLSFNKKIHSKRTDEQLENLKKETLKLVKEIELTREFSPTKSSLCHWCEYKPICPAWGNKIPERQAELGRYFSERKEF